MVVSVSNLNMKPLSDLCQVPLASKLPPLQDLPSKRYFGAKDPDSPPETGYRRKYGRDCQTSQATCQTSEIVDRVHCAHSTCDTRQKKTTKFKGD